jgi:hypothetical protein
MEDLLPVEAYYWEETGLWRRLPYVTGLSFGVLMSFIGLVMERPAGASLMSHAATALLQGVIGGALFGPGWVFWMRPFMRGLMTKMHRREGRYAAPVPDGDDYHTRLMCTLRKPSTLGISGVLYFGKVNMTFVPHEANRSAHRDPIRIPYSVVEHVQSGQMALSGLLRLSYPRPPTLLIVEGHQRTWEFIVPCIEQVQPRVNAIVRSSY